MTWTGSIRQQWQREYDYPGRNLEALKALQPGYEGRVKCIYIDLPYNTVRLKLLQNPLSVDGVAVMVAGQIGQLAPMDEETADLFQNVAKKMLEQ